MKETQSKEKKFWELEKEEKARIQRKQKETAEIAKRHYEQEYRRRQSQTLQKGEYQQEGGKEL